MHTPRKTTCPRCNLPLHVDGACPNCSWSPMTSFFDAFERAEARRQGHASNNPPTATRVVQNIVAACG